MTRLKKLMITLIFALVGTAPAAQAQTATLPVFTTALTEASEQAVNLIVRLAKDTKEAPLLFSEKKLPFRDFCKNLELLLPGLYITELSTYRRCYPEKPVFGSFDFPFLAKDWAGARQVINGPIGQAVSEGFNELGAQVMNFWDGETRVFSSNAVIASAADLKGKKVLSSKSFASSNAILQNGGTIVRLAFADLPVALEKGIADAADVSLSFYSKALVQAQKSVLISNHSFDPVVVTVPIKCLQTLDVIQRGFLESMIRQTTAFQIREARSTQEKNVAVLKERGVNVVVLSDEANLSFRTAGLKEASLRNAELVFAGVSPAVRAFSIAQAELQPISPYWKVFFATNRAAMNRKFTANISSGVLYGQAGVEFEFDGPLNTPVELINDLVSYDRKGGGIVIDWSKVSKAPFPKGFTKAKRAAPAKAAIIYVHGFANTIDDALLRAAWIGWNAKRPVVAFAWPSRGVPTPGDYLADRQIADQSLGTFAQVLEKLGRDYDAGTDVDIVAHSMGARVLLGALETLAQNNFPKKAPKFRQLVFVAPDIPADKLHQCWSGLLKYFDKSATLYVSDHDKALGISRDFMNPEEGPRAGLAPPVFVGKWIESIFIGPNDFSFIGHSYHVANGIIADDIFEVLRYGTSAQERRGSGPSPTGKGYFELRRLKNL